MISCLYHITFRTKFYHLNGFFFYRNGICDFGIDVLGKKNIFQALLYMSEFIACHMIVNFKSL